MSQPMELRRVAVFHPGRQHSHHLALALWKRDMLALFITGVPTRVPSYPALARVWRRLVKYAPVALPANKVRHIPIAPLLRKTIGRLLPLPLAVDLAHRADAFFDYWTARTLARWSGPLPDAVICYENAALRTFTVARRRGILTILDAAAVHHATRDRWCSPSESARAHARINRRKSREIDEAALILTVSNLARQSYLDAGVDPGKVVSIPVGVDTDVFTFRRRMPDATRPFRFVFAGFACRGKGFDILLAAFRRVVEKVPGSELVVMGDVESGVDVSTVSKLRLCGRVTQSRLAREFRDADCLVLPSRSEGFGMVVVEALATGLPVIVSDRVGAKEALMDGKGGWIVRGGDEAALASRMIWCATNPDLVAAMSHEAREIAARYTWERYERDVAQRIVEAVR